MAQAQFESHLDTVLKTTKEKLEKAAEIIGGMAESKAKQYITEVVYSTPNGGYIRTGNLRNSITHQTEETNEGTAVVIGSATSYAPFVELGTGKYAENGGRQTPWRYQDAKGNWHTTSGMPPRPFIRPAIENHKDEYRDILGTILKE